jgi:hypothetical protein
VSDFTALQILFNFKEWSKEVFYVLLGRSFIKGRKADRLAHAPLRVCVCGWVGVLMLHYAPTHMIHVVSTSVVHRSPQGPTSVECTIYISCMCTCVCVCVVCVCVCV